MDFMDRKNYLIKSLQLEDVVENGRLRGFFPSNIKIPKEIINTKKDRFLYSFAYYLLEYPNYGPFHAIEEVATWQVVEGCGLKIHMLYPNGKYIVKRLASPGKLKGKEEEYVVQVEPGVWQAAEIIPQPNVDFSLISHFVIPSFDYDGRKKGTKEILTNLFPHQHLIIDKFCWDVTSMKEKISSISSTPVT